MRASRGPTACRAGCRGAQPHWRWRATSGRPLPRRSDGRAQHRASIPEGITLDGAELHGETLVRIGWQHETWSLDVKKGADGWAGTYVRKALPLAKPVAVKGAVSGDVKTMEGAELWNVYLPNSARDGSANLTVAVVVKQGRVERAWSCSGQVGQSPAEVDAAGLTLKDGALAGMMTVIFHDDMFFDQHGDSAVAEERAAGHGGALAAAYTLTVKSGGDKQLSGAFEGTVGVMWQRTGTITGTLGPELPYDER